MDSVIASNFKESINILLSGMGGIFVVLLIIFLLIKGLIKVFPEK
ncbi:OadG-related small transporter subunit [Candidatus Clostridium stratigraminis]|jgi:Na+-transporting methylmalonyl-CoA/oxaloacetate decarboxylase gamma subunit|uniref:OadG-related small transporter subunit n=1 Tax=Candidatus Clostridium stratigraminis TaxID=3381661 RepID=A0ABW8T4L6_9CLOT